MVVFGVVLRRIQKHLELLIGHGKGINPKGRDMNLQLMIATSGGLARILYVDAFIVGAFNFYAINAKDKSAAGIADIPSGRVFAGAVFAIGTSCCGAVVHSCE